MAIQPNNFEPTQDDLVAYRKWCSDRNAVFDFNPRYKPVQISEGLGWDWAVVSCIRGSSAALYSSQEMAQHAANNFNKLEGWN